MGSAAWALFFFSAILNLLSLAHWKTQVEELGSPSNKPPGSA